MNRILLQDEFFITLFSVIDDLCKTFLPNKLGSSIGRKTILRLSELITVGVYFSLNNVNTFKSFYRLFLSNKYFSFLPEYSRLLRNVKEATYDVVFLIKIICAINCSMDSVSMIISANGDLGIGMTNTLGYKIYINGTGFLNSSAWVYSSDRNLKENIVHMGDNNEVLNKILGLKPVKFDYINKLDLLIKRYKK